MNFYLARNLDEMGSFNSVMLKTWQMGDFELDYLETPILKQKVKVEFRERVAIKSPIIIC